jgi:hypothetical protein
MTSCVATITFASNCWTTKPLSLRAATANIATPQWIPSASIFFSEIAPTSNCRFWRKKYLEVEKSTLLLNISNAFVNFVGEILVNPLEITFYLSTSCQMERVSFTKPVCLDWIMDKKSKE